MGQIESTVLNKSMYGSTLKCRNVIGAKETVKTEKAKQDEKKKTKDLYKSQCKQKSPKLKGWLLGSSFKEKRNKLEKRIIL